MATYSVVFEIELDEENPLAAAQTVQEWISDPDKDWQFYVQGDDKKIHSVDLTEADEDAVQSVDDYRPLID